MNKYFQNLKKSLQYILIHKTSLINKMNLLKNADKNIFYLNSYYSPV